MKKKYSLEQEKLINDGMEALVHSFMELIEPCIRRRCEQWFEVIEESIRANKVKPTQPKEQE